MSSLPVIPEPQALTAVEELATLEAAVTERLPTIEDTGQLAEMLARAHALEIYLRGRSMQAPARAIARRIEARIGELLGKAENRGPATVVHDQRLDDRRARHDFRRIAEAARGGRIENWALSRRALLRQVNGQEAQHSRVTAADEFSLLYRRLARVVELLDDIDMNKAGSGGRHSASHEEALRRVDRVVGRLTRFREQMTKERSP